MANVRRQKDSTKVNFLNSIKFKVVLVSFLSVFVTFLILELVFITNTKKTIASTNQNYLYDMAVQTGSPTRQRIRRCGLR